MPSGEYHFSGSTTVKPIVLEAASIIKTKYPEVGGILYESHGSTAGLKGLVAVNPINTLAGLSRQLTDKEIASGIKADPIAYDGIVVIANKQTVTVSNISREDLYKVFSGRITNWKDLGGPDKEIVVLNRDLSSGTRSWFEEVVMERSNGTGNFNTIIVTSNNDMIAKTAAIPYTIGYADLAVVYEEDEVKRLSIDEVSPSEENVKNGSYKLARQLYIAYTDQTLGTFEKNIIDFLLSPPGQSIVEELNFISIR